MPRAITFVVVLKPVTCSVVPEATDQVSLFVTEKLSWAWAPLKSANVSVPGRAGLVMLKPPVTVRTRLLPESLVIVYPLPLNVIVLTVRAMLSILVSSPRAGRKDQAIVGLGDSGRRSSRPVTGRRPSWRPSPGRSRCRSTAGVRSSRPSGNSSTRGLLWPRRLGWIFAGLRLRPADLRVSREHDPFLGESGGM